MIHVSHRKALDSDLVVVVVVVLLLLLLELCTPLYSSTTLPALGKTEGGAAPSGAPTLHTVGLDSLIISH